MHNSNSLGKSHLTVQSRLYRVWTQSSSASFVSDFWTDPLPYQVSIFVSLHSLSKRIKYKRILHLFESSSSTIAKSSDPGLSDHSGEGTLPIVSIWTVESVAAWKSCSSKLKMIILQRDQDSRYLRGYSRNTFGEAIPLAAMCQKFILALYLFRTFRISLTSKLG